MQMCTLIALKDKRHSLKGEFVYQVEICMKKTKKSTGFKANGNCRVHSLIDHRIAF